MPSAHVVIYREEDGSVPFVDWFDRLPAHVQDKVILRIARLKALGHELRRPEADYLRDGIYELRATAHGVHYRVLYFFHGQGAVVVAHGLVKKKAVPDRDISIALQRKRRFELQPSKHTLESD